MELTQGNCFTSFLKFISQLNSFSLLTFHLATSKTLWMLISVGTVPLELWESPGLGVTSAHSHQSYSTPPKNLFKKEQEMYPAVFLSAAQSQPFGDTLCPSVINNYDGLLISWLITFHTYHHFKEQGIYWTTDKIR